MARKKKQEVILLHGKSKFNMQAAKEVNLKLGELVVEHSEDGDVKLHALNNAGNGLGTFVTETKVDGKVKVVADKVDNLETVVGDAESGLVKGVADNAAAIKTLKDALGVDDETGETVGARLDTLEDAINGKGEEPGLLEDVATLKSDLNNETDGIKVRLEAVEGKATDNADDIAALNKTVNGEGEGEARVEGLVDKIAANEEAIETNADEIAKLKEYVVDGYTPEGEGAEKVNGLLDRVTVLENAIGDADAEGSIVDQLADAKTAIEALQDTVGDAESGLVKDVADLQATVGDATDGLVKDVADNAAAIAENKTAIDGLDKIVNGYDEPVEGGEEGATEHVAGLVEKVAANTTAIEGLKTQIGTDIEDALDELDVTAGDEDKTVTKYVSYVEQTDGKISAHYETLDAANVAAKYPHGETAAEMTVQQALDNLSAQDETLGGQIEAVDARIDAILGSDKATGDNAVQMTIRQIANAELAAQLLAGPDGVVDNFTTLQELAAWLEQHPEDAAAMNADILNLKTALAGYIVAGKDETVTVTDVKGVIDTLAQRLDNKDTELNNAITVLTETVNANKGAIDAYTVNGKKISENPSLVSGDIKMTTVVGAEQTVTEQTVQEAIAQVQANVTTVSNRVETVDDRIDAIAIEGTGIVVKRNVDKFTININVIDAGSYDVDTTEE